jgi:hypothetical protein
MMSPAWLTTTPLPIEPSEAGMPEGAIEALGGAAEEPLEGESLGLAEPFEAITSILTSDAATA